MTIWAAKAQFEELEKGSLEPGKAADLVILNVDLMKDSFEKIKKAKVLWTIVEGEVVIARK